MRASWRVALLLLLASCSGVGCSSLGFSDPDFATQVLLRESPGAERLHRRGVRLTRAGRFEEAEAAFQKSLLADESFGPAQNNIGLLYYKRGDLALAAQAFEQAMELLPDRGEPVNNLAMTLEEGGRFDEAIELYAMARALEPENPEYLGNLIRAKLRRGVVDFQLQQQLEELIFLETRPDWRAFALRQLTMMSRVTDSGPGEVDSLRSPASELDASEELPSPILSSPELAPADG